ncbi:MAG: hypothetical protein CMJ72_01200 [Planctomycetaceae bacterium]|nr:hypothetical protein [Planctomycetaceae bacterium]HCK40363.1 hypothetical protein [Planctomycetaceae bacterium]
MQHLLEFIDAEPLPRNLASPQTWQAVAELLPRVLIPGQAPKACGWTDRPSEALLTWKNTILDTPVRDITATGADPEEISELGPPT